MGTIVGIVPTNAFCDGEVVPPKQGPWSQGLLSRPRRRCRMNIAVYVRVSTPRQAQTQTIVHQLDQLRAHLESHGWPLAPEHIFRDDGYSGTHLARPG